MLGSGSRDGLAVFASPDFFKIVELQGPVTPAVEVADSFHIKPLVRIVQQGARFAVLCLSPNNVRLYEGNQYELHEVPLRNVPGNVNETLSGLKGNYPDEAYGQQHKMRPGQPPTDKDNMGMEPFLRAVDQALWENYSRDSRLPIVVCADTKPLMQFTDLTKNEFVLPQGINHSPQHMSAERLRDEAWRIIEPRYAEELERLKEQFRTAQAHQKGSDQLTQVAQAAAAGRVGTLLIDEQTKIPGILDRASGTIESIEGRSDAHAHADDVLDDLAEMVLQMDGQVYVIPHEQMPTDAGVAAVYRY
jgi:hypothetical protein